jgi:arylsulfatase A
MFSLEQPAFMTSDGPNVVIVFTDDQGYGDLGCYGSPYIDTPNIDRLARNGLRFTDFQAAPLCTPSRAALMTGSYPARVGLEEEVLYPGDDEGLHPDEVTIADCLSAAGYRTACIGKWHLGDHHPFLPTDHGFDAYFGVPYSNDMRPDNYHGVDKHPPLPLVRTDEVVAEEPDQSQLTRRYTEEAIEFVENSASGNEPFFCYLAHTMPHVPLFASEEFKGKSRAAIYGDVIEEIDYGVGRLVDTLESEGVADETLLIFTSDNGPAIDLGRDGGSAGPLRGGKRDPYEGGHRVPCVMHWPDTIPAGTVCRDLVSTMDILPTLASVAGVEDMLPADRVIDGHDCTALLSDPAGTASPRDTFAYHDAWGQFQAIREGGMKYYPADGELYDLHAEVAERQDISTERPDVCERLSELAADFQRDIEQHSRAVGREPGPQFTTRS